MNLSNGLSIQPRTLILEIVPGDAGHRRVPQLHLLDRFGHSPRLVDIEWLGLAGVDLTEVAAPSALFSADEERRLAVLRSWVRKEAAIKWMGSSIAQDLRHWCWDDTRQELSHLQQGLKPPSLCLESAGWFCGLVGEGAAAVQWGEHH